MESARDIVHTQVVLVGTTVDSRTLGKVIVVNIRLVIHGLQADNGHPLGSQLVQQLACRYEKGINITLHIDAKVPCINCRYLFLGDVPKARNDRPCRGHAIDGCRGHAIYRYRGHAIDGFYHCV
jgi:hypothetical protein